MPNLTVRKIPKEIYKHLKESAKVHRRSLNAEILDLLGDKTTLAMRRLEMKHSLPRLRKFREEMAQKYPTHLDSAALIREDRESR